MTGILLLILTLIKSVMALLSAYTSIQLLPKPVDHDTAAPASHCTPNQTDAANASKLKVDQMAIIIHIAGCIYHSTRPAL